MINIFIVKTIYIVIENNDDDEYSYHYNSICQLQNMISIMNVLVVIAIFTIY